MFWSLSVRSNGLPSLRLSDSTFRPWLVTVRFYEDSLDDWLFLANGVLNAVNRRFEFRDVDAASKTNVDCKKCLIGSELHCQQVANPWTEGSVLRIFRTRAIVALLIRSPSNSAPLSLPSNTATAARRTPMTIDAIGSKYGFLSQ